MSSERDDFDFRSAWAVSVDEMMRHLNEHSPTILHFSGHGAGAASRSHEALYRDVESPQEAGILLHNGDEAQYVSERALARMIRSASSSTRLVVLNACYTAAFGESLRHVVDCVIGIDGAIEDGAARELSVALYRALGHRCSVGNAVEQVIATLDAKQLTDHLPVCRTRDGLLAEELFLVAPGQRSSQSAETVSGRGHDAVPLTRPEETASLPPATVTGLYDACLVHPLVNKATADALFDLLHPDLQVFLAARSLSTTEHWDRDVRDAQRASRATVLLLSLQCDAAWYLSDEVLMAVARHRASPEAHRLVLLLLEPGITSPHSIRDAPTLDAIAVGGLDGVAPELRRRLAELRKLAVAPANSVRPPGSEQTSAGPSGRDHHVLYDRLSRLTCSVFDQILTHARIDRGTLAPRTATLTERALDLAQLAALDPSLRRRVSTELDRRAPWTRR